MGKGKHVPIRTCVSCGSKRPKNELIRLTLNRDGGLVTDVSLKMGGRGAYLCRNRSCKEQLFRKRGLNRLFRTDRAISVTPVLDDFLVNL